MSDTKISELPAMAYASIASGDWLPVVNSDLNSTRKLDISNMGKSYTTVAAFFADTNYTPIDGTIVTAGPVQFQADSTANITGLRAGWVPFGDVSEAHFDNDTDLRNFLRSTGAARSLDGTYTMTVDDGAGQPPAAIMGADKSIVANVGSSWTFAAENAGTTIFVGAAADFRGEGLTINATHDTSGATLQIFRPNDNFTLFGSKLDGGVTDVAGTASHVAHAYQASSNDFNGFTSAFNEYSGFSRVLLKASSSTAEHENLRFLFDTLTDNVGESIAINSPDGVVTGALILGGHSRNNIGDDVGASAHIYGGANVNGLRVALNYHHGKGDEIFHAEEGTELFTAVGNSGDFTTARAGIFLADNDENTGAVYKSVKKGSLVANSLKRATRLGGTAGIDFAPNGAGIHPAEEVATVANVASGWERGLRTAESPYLNLISGNIFSDNDTGIQMLRPSLMVEDNLLIDNDDPWAAQTGGLIGHQYFTRDSWDGTAPLIPVPNVSSGFTAGIKGWTAEYRPFTVASAGTNYRLSAMGSGMSGELTVMVSRNTSNWRMLRATVLWDGTTFTPTNLLSQGAGISLVDLRVDSGNLAIRLSAGSEQADCTMQARLDGVHMFTGA